MSIHTQLDWLPRFEIFLDIGVITIKFYMLPDILLILIKNRNTIIGK